MKRFHFFIENTKMLSVASKYSLINCWFVFWCKFIFKLFFDKKTNKQCIKLHLNLWRKLFKKKKKKRRILRELNVNAMFVKIEIRKIALPHRHTFLLQVLYWINRWWLRWFILQIMSADVWVAASLKYRCNTQQSSKLTVTVCSLSLSLTR